ncbi:MAG: EF-hand domain-containing protein [Candidatus Krumholzibacteriia bacterium]
MASRRWSRHRGSLTARAVWLACLVALLAAGTTPALAWKDLQDPLDAGRLDPHGLPVVDGKFVMNVGELQINITNWGLIGSQYSNVSTYSDAPSAQWPAGSGVEYLWGAGLWVGGVLVGQKLVSTGEYEHEIRCRDDIRDTLYEAKGTKLLRPAGNDIASGRRLPEPLPDDDGDGKIDEETINGYDDDGDGKIDEDFGQIGNQMIVATMVDNTRLSQEQYPSHTPLNLQIVQQSYQWENDDVDDFVGFEFLITNIGVSPITNVYIGFFADCDIGARTREQAAEDDLAGYFEGRVLAKDGSYVPVSIGYMYDDDGDDGQAPGYFGILFLGHDTDPTGETAPQRVKVRSYQAFSGQSAFEQGGDPTNDEERYQLLSVDEKDANTPPNKKADFRFLVSAGPFKTLEADRTLRFQAAMVVGPGLEGMLANAAEAALTFYGNYINLDGNPETGVNGRETKICQEDFPVSPSGTSAIFTFVPDYMDTTCVSQEFILSQARITSSDLRLDSNPTSATYGKHCIYVNSDNCFECFRQNGAYCTPDNPNPLGLWNCWNPEVTNPADKAGCTGIDGNEFVINWIVGMAPPPPGLRLMPIDNAVAVFWNNLSEVTKDVRSNQIDFESYRIWRADNWTRPFGSSLANGPENSLWQLIAEYDLKNSYIRQRVLTSGVTVTDTLPLGANTGLDGIRYTPVCLADTAVGQRFHGLPQAMREIVDQDVNGLLSTIPLLRDREGVPLESLLPLIPWEGYPAELDTFFWVLARPGGPGIVAKEATNFYQYIDRDVHNGFIAFYSVTATDHALRFPPDGSPPVIAGAGQSGDAGSSFQNTVPAALAQTAEERSRIGANIYVYPNPATRDALAPMQLLPNADDPTGVRIIFANLPAARNTIKIFTEDGDLVQTIEHDGTTGYGQASWNLVSRNGQEIVSGIYLYAVQSADSRFKDFIGKFVVVR